MNDNEMRCASAEWIRKNKDNPFWWREQHYWNVCCDTCEFKGNGGTGCGKHYGQKIEDIKKTNPGGCSEWGIDFDSWYDDASKLDQAGGHWSQRLDKINSK